MRINLFTILSVFVFALGLKAQNFISSSNTLICAGESVTLTANHDFLHNWFLWSNGATTKTIVVSPTVTTSYTLNLADADANIITVSFTQSVSLCLGLNKTEANDPLQIFPNPCTEKITLNGLEKQSLIVIHNALGSIIYQDLINEQKTEIDISNYSPGVYFIKIKTADAEIVRKIIKE